MMYLSKEEEKEIIEVIREAGGELLKLWPASTDRKLDIEIKSDGSPVTEADFRSNKILTSFLVSKYPNDGIFSEESKEKIDQTKFKRVWVIDPLDGTRSFIEGRDDFSIQFALKENNESVFGVMYFPAKSILVSAQRGQGAYRNGEKLPKLEEKPLREKCTFVGHADIDDEKYRYPERIDSGFALYKVAIGEFDRAVMNMQRYGEWDVCAGKVVIREVKTNLSSSLRFT